MGTDLLCSRKTLGCWRIGEIQESTRPLLPADVTYCQGLSGCLPLPGREGWEVTTAWLLFSFSISHMGLKHYPNFIDRKPGAGS